MSQRGKGGGARGMKVRRKRKLGVWMGFRAVGEMSAREGIQAAQTDGGTNESKLRCLDGDWSHLRDEPEREWRQCSGMEVRRK
jgi:hypothetical protein